MSVWADPFLPSIKIPSDLDKQVYQLGSFKFKLLPKQFVFMSAGEEFVGYISGVGGGKALALDTPIPTRDGWTTMGDIQVGDVLFDETGQLCNVVVVEPIQFGNQCFDVIFSDGTVITADADHLWSTETVIDRKARWRGRQPFSSARTTAEIAASLEYRHGKHRSRNHAIPVCGLLDCIPTDLPIDPYVLGVWLGDGDSAGAVLTTEDPQILAELQRRGCASRILKSSANRFAIGFKPKVRNSKGQNAFNDSLNARLRRLGLLKNKHVPMAYLRASIGQRLELLRGLMDTDGYAALDGGCEFTSMRRSLADGVLELARTLGLKATFSTGRATIKGRDVGEKYRVRFTPYIPVFHLNRKLERLHTSGKQGERQLTRYIVRVTKRESVAVRCIAVDSPSHLFLASRAFIPTHNTRIGAIKSMYMSMIPNNRGLVGRFALPDLLDTAQRDLLDILREARLLKEAPNSLNKRALVHCVDPATNQNTGLTSEITFQHLDDPDHLRGKHLGWFWIDEGSELRSIKAWTVLVGRMRWPAAKGRYKGMVTGNPRGRNWIYDFFFNKELLEVITCGGRPGAHVPSCKLGDLACNKRLRMKRRAIHSISYENHFLPSDYIENMIASYTDEQRRREVEAEFDVFEGQIFKEFDERIHVFEPPPSWPDGRPPKEWRRLLAVDVGGASPWVFLWSAVDPDGNLIFYDELWEVTSDVQRLANQALPRMKDERGGDYDWQAKVIDYENKIAATDLQRCGISMTNARKMNKSGDGGSTSLLSSYLHPNHKHHFPAWHHLAGHPSSPRAFISSRCRVLRRELPQQAWSQVLGADGFRDVMDRLIPHDTVDTALYTVREMPHPSTIAPAKYAVTTSPNISKMSELYWSDLAAAKERQRDLANARRPYRKGSVMIDELL